MKNDAPGRKESSKSSNPFWFYPSSWLDTLLTWMETLPGPIWLSHTLLIGLLILLNNAMRWLEPGVNPGSFDLIPTLEVPLLYFFVPFTHYLRGVARKSLSLFRPLLNLSEAEYNRLLYELQMLARRPGLLAAVIGLPVGILSVQADPVVWGLGESSSAIYIAYRMVVAAAILIIVATFLFHTLHQLRVVARIQRMAVGASLFQSAPLYAFSSLTSRTGLGIIAMTYYYLFLTYSVQIYGPVPPMSAIDLMSFGILFVTALGAFAIPLSGMHTHLVEEKLRASTEAGQKIDKVLSRLHTIVDRDDLVQVDSLNKALSSLFLEVEALKKISTWPWDPGTLRGLISAILLPVLIWLITTLLGRVV